MSGVSRVLLALWAIAGSAHALFTGAPITAFPVPNGTIALDTVIETAWKEIAAQSGGYTTLRFNDYGKIVLLDSDPVRNDDPRKHYTAPDSGSVTLLAAYDDNSLYFLFLIREVDRFSPSRCAGADLWRAHAADLFLDTLAWNETLYPFQFSTDAGGLTYGTSRSTLELAKPAFPGEIRKYYRDRSQGNRFEFRNPSTSLLDARAFSRAGLVRGDSLSLAVEMRIPYNRAVNPRGKSIYLSWGYNRYPSGNRAACDRNPIAYRWAKHHLSYDESTDKPDSWVEGDSTHYDPTRSYDGWGRLDLGTSLAGFGSCDPRMEPTTWDPAVWAENCKGGPATSRKPRAADRRALKPPSGALGPGGPLPRDLRGRYAPEPNRHQRLFSAPGA